MADCKLSIKPGVVALCGVILAVAGGGCGGSGSSGGRGTPGTFMGQSLPVGNGTAQSFITIGNDGRPTALGATLTESALTGLPPQEKTLYQLGLPAEASLTPFDHIEFRYWSNGHDPQELFAIEHFDIIPFLISQQERDAITATGEDIDRVLEVPPSDQIPIGYAPIPSVDEFFAEPRYGTRYFDVPSFTPVLTGTAAYTTTLFYGYYDGRVTFMEIPVTVGFLTSQSDVSFPFPLPDSAPIDGFYPTRYRLRHDVPNQQYTFTMEGFVAK